MKGPLFYAKILLFGEYGIIKDSKGLAIPYNSYQGALKVTSDLSETAINSNKKLKDFLPPRRRGKNIFSLLRRRRSKQKNLGVSAPRR